MSSEQSVNLIRLFDFYLTIMFLMSFLRRYDVYINAIRILIAVRGRWPRLMSRLAEHKSLILNWSFFRPAILALTLAIVQMIASRLIWPEAVVTFSQLYEDLWLMPVILIPFILMLAVDTYFIIRVGRFDHDETIKYLDMAENWLGWKGPFVRIVTFGLVNPRKMVDVEVQKSLTEMRTTITSSLWWVIVQTSLRITFGLTLWSVWVLRE